MPAVALLTNLSAAHAQQPAFPSKPIRLIASQTAGANGTLAGALTAKSPPNGHPPMIGAMGNLAVNTFFIKQMSYEPLQDLAPVTLAVSSANVLVVHPSVPAR